MPTYEYICRSCGHLFEIVQSMRDASLTECPECGGELRKVFAPPAIAFKGSGFYATDQRKKATTGSGEKAEKGDKKDAGSDASDGKKDSKSDAPAAGAKKEASTSSASSTSTSSGSSSGSPSKEGSDS